MSAPPKPATQKEMLDQVWWILVGSNGDGVVSQVKAIRVETTKLTQVVPGLATKVELDAAIDAHEQRDIERRKQAIKEAQSRSMTVREWLQTAGTVGSFLWPILAALWFFVFNHPAPVPVH